MTSANNTTNLEFTEILADLGIAPTPGALLGLDSLAHYEGQNDRFNPLNVVQPEPGSTNFNSKGVQSYPTLNTGVLGSATLLEGSRWDAFRTALASGNASAVVAAADQVYDSWSPGTNIPVLDPSTAAAVGARTVGPLAGAMAPFAPTAGATQAADLTAGSTESAFSIFGIPIPGTPSGSDILGGVTSLALNGFFLATGLGLVVLGVWKATSGPRQKVEQSAQAAAPIVAAAA